MIRISTPHTLGKLIGAAAISAAFMAPAHADIIGFDNLLGEVGNNTTMLEQGYKLTGWANVAGAPASALVGAVLDGADMENCVARTCPVNNSSHYYAALNDGVMSLQSPGVVGTVQLSSFDASFIGDNSLTYPSIAGLLRVQGFFAGGGSMFQDFLLSGPVAGAFKFAHYNVNAAMSAASFAEIAFFGFTCNNSGNCSAFSTNRGQFALDNLDVSANVEVPEPGTGLLLGLGLLGMGAFARRRSA